MAYLREGAAHFRRVIRTDIGDNAYIRLKHSVLGIPLQIGVQRHAFDDQHLGLLLVSLAQDVDLL